MADQNTASEELLLDVRVAEASKLYKFYLNNEKKILGTFSVSIFLLVWELTGNVFQMINPMFMSAPSLIWKAAVQLFVSGEIWHDLRASGIEFAWGYILSVIVGVPFGIAIGWYKKLAYVCDPFVNAMNATPRVALLPLIIIWLGIGILSKIGIIFLGAVFPLLINTRDGVKTTPHNLLTAARSFGASEWQIFRSVVIPSTVPFILTGLRLGVALSFFVIVISEFIGAEHGLGYLINDGRNFFLVPQMLGAAVVLGLLGYAGNALVRLFERRVLRWQSPS